MRRFWVLAHRYAGLAMAGFLVLVGLTGSLLAFLPEINQALTPHLPARPAHAKHGARRVGPQGSGGVAAGGNSLRVRG